MDYRFDYKKGMDLGTFLSRGKIYFFIFSVNEIRFFEFWVENFEANNFEKI